MSIRHFANVGADLHVHTPCFAAIDTTGAVTSSIDDESTPGVIDEPVGRPRSDHPRRAMQGVGTFGPGRSGIWIGPEIERLARLTGRFD